MDYNDWVLMDQLMTFSMFCHITKLFYKGMCICTYLYITLTHISWNTLNPSKLSNFLYFVYCQVTYSFRIYTFKLPYCGYQILATRFWLPHSGYEILATRFRLPDSSYHIPAMSFWLPDSGKQILVSFKYFSPVWGLVLGSLS